MPEGEMLQAACWSQIKMYELQLCVCVCVCVSIISFCFLKENLILCCCLITHLL